PFKWNANWPPPSIVSWLAASPVLNQASALPHSRGVLVCSRGRPPTTQPHARHIAQMRKAAGLTQRELAARLEREHSYVARIETQQRRVDLVELIVICRACGVDPQKQVASLARQLDRLLPMRDR